MRPSLGLVGLVLLLAPTILAQGVPEETTDVAPPNEEPTATGDENPERPTETATETEKEEEEEEEEPTPTDDAETTSTEAPPENTETTTTDSEPATRTGETFQLTDAPTIAGYSIPEMFIPDTARAPFMQKSNLPDGTVFICVGAALGFFGAAILAWRGLVAWSLHRSVKRAARAQNIADMKAMTAVPGKKRGLYNVVGANSNMSLDRLSAAPTGTSRPSKPFASTTTSGTPPKANSSLFFSPTAGGAAGLRDSVNRSSNYLPAGYYASGTAQPAAGSPLTHVGGPGAHLSTHSLATPGNRFSSRSGISPPGSPSLPPSRGYDRAPPSRDGISMYHRNSVATLGAPANRAMYTGDAGNMSQLSLNVPGGTSVAGARAPSAYLEDLFENHGSGPRERF